MSLFTPASPKQELMLQRVSDTQVTIIGGAAGSGKTAVLRHLPLMFADDPYTNTVFYRLTNPQLEAGFWPDIKDVYRPISKIREQKKEVHLKDGGLIRCQQAENVDKACWDAQGQEVTLYGIDEATQFEWRFLHYLFSRMRSKSKYFSRIVMSCNPDPDHKIRELISWYLDEDGYPDPEKDGVVRYFYMMDGLFHWGDSKEELGEKFNIAEKDYESKILSFSFVSATIYDNPIVLERDPAYLAFLEGLEPVEKARLLHGNWDARAKGSAYFQREWLVPVDRVPFNALSCRGYDLAATERSEVNRTPDATASVKVSKDTDGYFYISGDYHPLFLDDGLDVYGRVCKRVGERDNIMLKQAAFDGDECVIISPIDPAAAGKQVFNEMAKKFSAAGFRFKKDPIPSNKSKMNRFLPFADAAENGLIRVVKDSFDIKTYEYIMKELEAFDGERSTAHRKDDYVDSIATAYNWLCVGNTICNFTPPSISSPTMYSNFNRGRRR